MPCSLSSIVGTTTSVRDEGGMPSEKSMRGSVFGKVSSVASQLTMDTASWLDAISTASPAGTSHPAERTVVKGCEPPAEAHHTAATASKTLAATTVPAYHARGRRATSRRARSHAPGWVPTRRSSCGRPASTR